jgi:hypothetical protein
MEITEKKKGGGGKRERIVIDDHIFRLTTGEKKFADLVLADVKPPDAAVAAGYKVKDKNSAAAAASVMIHRANVAEYIDFFRSKAAAKMEKKLEISKEKNLKILLEVAERCNQDIAPMMDRRGKPMMVEDKNGNECAAYSFNAKGVVSAIAEINKMQGYLAPTNVDLTSKGDKIQVGIIYEKENE